MQNISLDTILQVLSDIVILVLTPIYSNYIENRKNKQEFQKSTDHLRIKIFVYKTLFLVFLFLFIFNLFFSLFSQHTFHYKTGDFNMDGKVNKTDYVDMQEYITASGVKNTLILTPQIKLCDLNKDGIIDANDLSMLMAMIDD